MPEITFTSPVKWTSAGAVSLGDQCTAESAGSSVNRMSSDKSHFRPESPERVTGNNEIVPGASSSGKEGSSVSIYHPAGDGP